MKIIIILPDNEDVARKTYRLLTGKEPKPWGSFQYRKAALHIKTPEDDGETPSKQDTPNGR